MLFVCSISYSSYLTRRCRRQRGKVPVFSSKSPRFQRAVTYEPCHLIGSAVYHNPGMPQIWCVNIESRTTEVFMGLHGPVPECTVLTSAGRQRRCHSNTCEMAIDGVATAYPIRARLPQPDLYSQERRNRHVLRQSDRRNGSVVETA